MFSLLLAVAISLHVDTRNFKDEGGVDYSIRTGQLAARRFRPTDLRRPFSWTAARVARSLSRTQQPDNDHTLAERLLLLLPACTDSDRPSAAVDIVAAAVTSSAPGPASIK